MQIGAQLYTIRDFCKTPEALSESLARVAEIGYKTVQISGTCEYEPAWLAKELKKNGLTCVLTHIPKEKLLEMPTEVAHDHDIFGCACIGLGGIGFDNPDNIVTDFIRDFKPVAQAIHDGGKYFMYHNHAHEFKKIDGKLIIEHLAESFSADLMGFTLDTYWVQAAGGDPAQWIEKLAGRVPCIHLKDHAFDRKMAVLGEGNINFERIFASAEKAGTKYMLVEQDNCNGENPFDCLTRSYKYLKSRGFE